MALTKKTKRILLICVGIVIVVPIVALLVVLLQLGVFIKLGFEKAGPQVLGVSTRLDEATVSLLKGQVSLKGLAIGNPEGYTAPTFVEADLIRVAANIGALRKNEIHIREVSLDGPEFTIEYRKGKSNIKAFMEKLEGDEKGKEEKLEGDEKGKEEKLEDVEEDKDGPTLKIDLVDIKNAKLNVMIMDQEVKVSLPSVKITGIADKDGNGVSPGKVAQAILGKIQAQVAQLPELAKALGELSETAGELGNMLKDEGLGVGEGVKDTGSKLFQDAKGLLKKNEK